MMMLVRIAPSIKRRRWKSEKSIVRKRRVVTRIAVLTSLVMN